MRKLLYLTLVTLILMSSAIASELDLREANVVDVTYDDLGEDLFDFHVTLLHDDDGEEDYADSWQIETLSGGLLGERILTHAHGTAEFTRSQDINIGDNVMLVVRGHDQTHGFGGQVIILNISSGIIEKIDQGAEPLDFSNYTVGVKAVYSEFTISTDNADFSPYPISVLIISLPVWYSRKRKNTTPLNRV